jgi:ribonucleoside-diphosphate reductase alpha chain
MAAVNEPELSGNALRILRARYLMKDKAQRVVETPGEMFLRVAEAVASVERRYGEDADRRQRDFLDAMLETRFLPNSPTLMNAGKPLAMLSACFVLPVEDSVNGIFESVKYAAMIQKAGGGTGFAYDRLRPTGDYIHSSGGRSSGPVSFWRVFCEATRAIQQGASRRGANMGMMSIEHPDILKFICAKQLPGEFENFNISVKVPDAFMEALRCAPDPPHVVINPRTNRRHLLPRGLDVERYALTDLAREDEAGTDAMSRREVWDLIVRSAWDTGEPGVCFIDRINADNPTPALGRIEATNPCGEQPLLPYEACNLGSIDLSKFVRDGELDEDGLRGVVRLGVRFLDDVINASHFLVPEIESRCRGNRKIGLGIMGFADAMYELGIKYDSDEGLAFGRRVAALLFDEATAASEALAKERGVFPNFAGSVWDRRGRPMRNAAVTCIAPTGTISILAGCTGGIEPAYALAFKRHVLEGQEMLEVNGPLRRYAEQHGLWSEEVGRRLAEGAALSEIEGFGREACDLFVTAHDVSPEWHVRMQAAFQECLDGAISKTINLPNAAEVAAVDEVYRLAHDLGCKGVTVYRDGCRRGQPMARGKGEEDGQTGPSRCPRCGASIDQPEGCSRCPACGGTVCP